MFPHYLKNGTIFGKKTIEYKNMFLFLYNFLPEAFHITRGIKRVHHPHHHHHQQVHEGLGVFPVP